MHWSTRTACPTTYPPTATHSTTSTNSAARPAVSTDEPIFSTDAHVSAITIYAGDL